MGLTAKRILAAAAVAAIIAANALAIRAIEAWGTRPKTAPAAELCQIREDDGELVAPETPRDYAAVFLPSTGEVDQQGSTVPCKWLNRRGDA